jgi:hypothetical protein
VTFRTNYARTLLFTLLGGAFIWLTYSLTQLPGLYERIVGWIGLPFSIYVTLQGLVQLGRGGSVVISDTGIVDSRLGPFEIAWADIVAADVVVNQGARYLRLRLSDPSKHLERMPFVNRIPSRFVLAIGLSPFNISFATLTPGIDEALPAIAARLSRAGT